MNSFNSPSSPRITYSERRIPEWLLLLAVMYAGFAIGRLVDVHNQVQPHEKSEASAQVPVEQQQWQDKTDLEVKKYAGGFFEMQEDYRKCSMYQPYPRTNHACRVNDDTHIPICLVDNLAIHPTKISSQSNGGEDLKDVMGQAEEAEMVAYQSGAFTVLESLDTSDVHDHDYMFYIHDVLNNMSVDTNPNCKATSDTLTLLITRYDYVDLFHTVRDWWNAFMALPEPTMKADIIFLDAHPKGHLDEFWKAAFGGTVRHVRHIDSTLCLPRAILVPAGYSSVLWPRDRWFQARKCPSMAKAFEKFAVSADLAKTERERGRILLIDWKPWLLHPRASLANDEKEIDNLVDLRQRILKNVENVTRVEMMNLDELPIMKQLEEIRKADIIIGTSHTELSHIMFVHDGTALIEINPSADVNELAGWRPNVTHEPLSIAGQSHKLEDLFMDEQLIPLIKYLLYPDKYPNPGGHDEENEFIADDIFIDQEDNVDEIDFGDKPLYDNATVYTECALNGPMPRPSHGCRTDSETKVPFCSFSNFAVDVTKVTMTAKGGENLTTVMGQSEDAEFPEYTVGAFSVQADPDIPKDIDTSLFHYMTDVLAALVTEEQECAHEVKGVTLFLTRYEYVNLYHTLSDWWNSFLSLPQDRPRSVSVVFLDGHASGNLDPVWEELFGNVTFVKRLPEEGRTCFEKAVLVPPGYSSVLFPSANRWFASQPCPAMTEAFVDFFVDGFGLGDVKMQQGKVTIIDRKPYVSHPRVDLTRRGVERELINLDELRDKLAHLSETTSVDLVRLESLPFKEQLRLIRETHVLIGNHGAGLTFVFFMQANATVGEFGSDANFMMNEIAKWRPGTKHRLLPGATETVSKRDMDDVIVPWVKELLSQRLSTSADVKAA